MTTARAAGAASNSTAHAKHTIEGNLCTVGRRPGGTSRGADLWWAVHLLRRAHVVERVLVAQIDVLETMTPQDFLEFRERLAPASGFQSVQFRELEFLSGAKDASYVERFRGLTEAEKQHLDSRLAEPSTASAPP